MTPTADVLTLNVVSPRHSPWQRVGITARRYPLGFIGFLLLLCIAVVAVGAPLIAPYEPNEVGVGGSLEKPSVHHLLGTDLLGRDLLSRMIYGTRVSLYIGFVAVGVAGCIGVPLGLLSGYRLGLVDALIMRIVDAVIAFPGLILVLAAVATFGGGLKVVMVALGFSLMPAYARIVRGQVLSVKATDYVASARAIGATGLRVVMFHVVPNVWAPVLVIATLGLAGAVIAEASLSFLGIGVKPPQATWGNMLLDGFPRMQRRPMMAIAPGAAIWLLVLSFNCVGDALRDALDPTLRGSRK